MQSLRGESFNLVSWFRPPNAPIDSCQQLKVLAFIDREAKETILFGDVNYNSIQSYVPSSLVQNIRTLYQLFGHSQETKEATKVAPTTSTLLTMLL